MELGECRLLPLQIFLGIGTIHVRLRQFVLLLLRLLLRRCNLCLLRSPELRKGFRCRHLRLLRFAEVTLHLLLELFQDAKDLTALRSVARNVARSMLRLHKR